MINKTKYLALTKQSYENYFHTLFCVIKVSSLRPEVGKRKLFVIKQKFVIMYSILKVVR